MNEDERERHAHHQETVIEVEPGREQRHHWVQVQFPIHPLASLLIAGLICVIIFSTWAVYAIAHHQDFIATSLGLMHDGTWAVKVVAVMGLVWLGVVVAGQFITRVLRPLIAAVHEGLVAAGQLKRNKVLAKMEQYAIFEDATGVAGFHQITQDKSVYNYKLDQKQLEQLPSPDMQQPTQEYAISQLQENRLQVCLGVSTTTRKPLVINLLDGVHYRILGASGMGKSCFAASFIDMITQTNDEHQLQIALLDSEHKTSRLFETLPHVAELQVGRRRVECIATTPEEVATYMGYLKLELDRRKELSELDLQQERFMLIYVEEFLSLKREIPKQLRMQFLRDFSIMALRGRKYKLYLLACAQVDYASKAGGEEAEILREAQIQFSVNASFAIKPTAAQSVGFTNNELIEQNFQAKRRGQMVLEMTGVSDIFLTPYFDVASKLIALERSAQRSPGVQDGFNPRSTVHLNADVNASERASEDRSGDINFLAELLDLVEMGWNKQEIVERLWHCKKGGSKAWQDGSQAYDAIIRQYRPERAIVESEAV